MRSAQNVHLWMAGITLSKSNFGTTNGQACMQYRQPMERHELKTTGPSSVLVRAVVGHGDAQAGSGLGVDGGCPAPQSALPVLAAPTPGFGNTGGLCGAG